MPANTAAAAAIAVPSSNMDFFFMMLVIMNEAIAITMLYPFVGLLIVHLSPGLSEADAGTWSGLLVGSFQIAQAMFASVWGRKSDRLGRRPMLALGLSGGAFFSLCFGMSTHVWQLLLFRFLYGVANGNAPLVKTMIAETATRGNEANGWAMMSVAWSLGSTMGPMIGGLLYDPASRMDSFKGTIFESRPALLPSLFSAVYSIFALGITVLRLPESNVKARPPPWLAALMSLGGRVRRSPHHDDNDDDDDVAPQLVKRTTVNTDPVRRAPTPRIAESRAADDEEMIPIASEDHDSAVDRPAQASRPDTILQSAVVHAPTEQSIPAAAYGIPQMLADPRMCQVLVAYVVVACMSTSFSEVFPLLAILPVSQGGLGVDASVIGVIYMCFASETIVGNLVFPGIIKRHGRAKTARLALAMTATFVVLHAALPAIDWQHNVTGIVVASAVLSLPRMWGASWVGSVLTMGIAASAPKEHLGAATGISHSCGNVARAIVPSFMTYLFAWSVNYASGGSGANDRSEETLQPTATSQVAVSEEPQSFFGPAFPLNRWLVFVLVGVAQFGIAFLLRDATDAAFQRDVAPAAPEPSTQLPTGASREVSTSTPVNGTRRTSVDLAQER
jgi:MFS family permease